MKRLGKIRKVRQFLDDGTDSSVYTSEEKARVVIIPVPLEKTVSYLGGTARGPEKILEASAQVELFDPETQTVPCRRIGLHTSPAIDCRGRMETVLSRLQRRTAALARKGQVPVCLGGEHALSLAPIRALNEHFFDLSVLHLDAHADLRDSYSGTRFSHACVMRRVRELGLLTVSVGVRSISEEESEFIRRSSLRLFPAWEYGPGSYPWERIAKELTPRVYVSVDMDVFDPSEVPAVGTPEPGGLRWSQARELWRALRRSGKKVVGFDLVELCPRPGSIVSDFFAARLLYQMIGYFCLDR